MGNTWNMVRSDEEIVALGPASPDWDESKRCAERLADLRCILAAGHEGNHVADERDAKGTGQR